MNAQHSKRFAAAIFVTMLGALLLSCPNPVGPGDDQAKGSSAVEYLAAKSPSGTLEVRLTNTPPEEEVTSLWITILRVMAHGETTGWHTITPEESDFDLLGLADDVARVGVAALPADYYTQLRLVLSDGNRLVFADGKEFSLFVPSGQQTGIKITGGFELREGHTVRIVLDFDCGQSLKRTGRGRSDRRYLLTPVIRIREVVLEPEKSPAPAPPPPTPEGYPRLVIDTYSADGSMIADTFVDLFGEAGDTDTEEPWDQAGGSPAAIAWADNGNPDFTFMARVDYTGGLPAGTYYIRLRGATKMVDDFYAIRVLAPAVGEELPEYRFPGLSEKPDSYEPDDEPRSGGVPATPVPILLGNDNALSRSLHYSFEESRGDIDWFVLELP